VSGKQLFLTAVTPVKMETGVRQTSEGKTQQALAWPDGRSSMRLPGAGSGHGEFSTTCPPTGNAQSFHGTSPSEAGRNVATEVPDMISPLSLTFSLA